MTTASQRFWAKVNKTDGCWEWIAGRTSAGYGGFHPDGVRLVLAHRWAYEQLVGPIPEGRHLDHLCHNDTACRGGRNCQHRLCVNPAHLEAVSPETNLHRSRNYNGNKRFCQMGHPYDEANTYINGRGSRVCRACARERDRLRVPRRKRAKEMTQ